MTVMADTAEQSHRRTAATQVYSSRRFDDAVAGRSGGRYVQRKPWTAVPETMPTGRAHAAKAKSFLSVYV